uniref:Secreted protein n=1 Tax=Heterorhabditis bacteriophora TaxID=37862 RepID=A0A1I7WWR5_HETBA
MIFIPLLFCSPLFFIIVTTPFSIIFIILDLDSLTTSLLDWLLIYSLSSSDSLLDLRVSIKLLIVSRYFLYSTLFCLK